MIIANVNHNSIYLFNYGLSTRLIPYKKTYTIIPIQLKVLKMTTS